MLLIMTAEQSRAWKKRVKDLMSSNKVVDQITGILHDSSIGGHGMFEGAAKDKAEHILKAFKVTPRR